MYSLITHLEGLSLDAVIHTLQMIEFFYFFLVVQFKLSNDFRFLFWFFLSLIDLDVEVGDILGKRISRVLFNVYEYFFILRAFLSNFPRVENVLYIVLIRIL